MARAAWQGLAGFYRSSNLTQAASIAYYALVSLFPTLLLALTLVGRATADPVQRAAALDFILRYFPTQFDFIARQLEAFRLNGPAFGLGGTLALLWGAVGVFSAISTAVNHAWGVAEPRTFWKQRLFSFVMLAFAGLILLLALLLISASHLVEASWSAEVLARFPGLLILRSLAARHAPTVLFILVVGLVYYFVPATTVRFRDVWVGALATGLLWKVAIELFAWYAGDMSQFTRVNGSVAVVIVFLVWVYTQAVILLYGVEFTAAYARLREENG